MLRSGRVEGGLDHPGGPPPGEQPHQPEHDHGSHKGDNDGPDVHSRGARVPKVAEDPTVFPLSLSFLLVGIGVKPPASPCAKLAQQFGNPSQVIVVVLGDEERMVDEIHRHTQAWMHRRERDSDTIDHL